MGTCLSGVDDNTKAIESHMKEAERYEQSLQKLLFLGAGGSGKSTIFKQLQYLHCSGFTQEDALHLKRHIFLQTISTMQAALKYLSSTNSTTDVAGDSDVTTPLAGDSKDQDLSDAIDMVLNYKDAHILTPDIAKSIALIWKEDRRFVGIFEDINASLDQTTRHFWDDLDRICKDDDVHAVVFVVSLSSYNEMMFEEKTKNAMVDSMELFRETVADRHFDDSSFITFLNKKDLFEEKIAKVPITVCPAFASFEGDSRSYGESTAFIKEQFEDIVR